MLKLMKYELRKTAFSKLVLLVITAVAEIAFLIGVFWKKDNILAMGIIFLVMCTIFGVIYIGIESVNVLHRDLNTKQSQDPGKWNFHYHGRRIFCSVGSH